MADNVNIDLAAANAFNANNRNRGNGGQNNLMNVRDRLFHAIYFKVAIMYAQIFPKPMQRALEYLILIKALLFFFALVYIHMSFIKNPATCLSHIKDWPRDGVLRVEVIPNLAKQRALLAKTKAEEQLVRDLQTHYHYGIGPQTKDNYYRLKEYEKKLFRAGYQLRPTFAYANETLIYYFKTEATPQNKQNTVGVTTKSAEKADISDDDEQYIVEYSLEYGHLRLSPATRKRLKIPVSVVQLDPLSNKCFGDKLSKFLLKELLGYDDLLMASVRVIAEKEDNKGYLRNVITGEHYRFVSMWWAAWSSYPTAFFVMLLFTFSISMLLRFSHHQIFVFIVDLLQMLEFNVSARFPIAPLLTVILALVGMEAIMSEFFNDATTAFYIILIVWIADQYDAICCHTSITRRHWLRFFYLYHFAFYAYHYRFSGQNRSLALVSSWLFIQHSMFYFFHHYELPVILQQAQVLIITRNQAAGGPQQQLQAGQQQQGQPQQEHAPTIIVNRFFRRAASPPGVGIPPFVANLLQQAPDAGGALGALRRALTARGWIAPVGVRMQIGNLQRINLGTIHINPVNLTAATAAAVQQQQQQQDADAVSNNGGDVTTTTTTASNGNVSFTSTMTTTTSPATPPDATSSSHSIAATSEESATTATLPSSGLDGEQNQENVQQKPAEVIPTTESFLKSLQSLNEQSVVRSVEKGEQNKQQEHLKNTTNCDENNHKSQMDLQTLNGEKNKSCYLATTTTTTRINVADENQSDGNQLQKPQLTDFYSVEKQEKQKEKLEDEQVCSKQQRTSNEERHRAATVSDDDNKQLQKLETINHATSTSASGNDHLMEIENILRLPIANDNANAAVESTAAMNVLPKQHSSMASLSSGLPLATDPAKMTNKPTSTTTILASNENENFPLIDESKEKSKSDDCSKSNNSNSTNNQIVQNIEDTATSLTLALGDIAGTPSSSTTICENFREGFN